MVSEHKELGSTIKTIHETMVGARKLKNAALLRNLTSLAPVVYNATRWSGKLHMLDRFVDIRDDLIDVCNSEDGEILIDSSSRMLTKAVKYQKMLRVIDVVTKSLQKRGHTIAACRDDLDTLIDAAIEERAVPASPFYQCKLGTKYMSSTSFFITSPAFEFGVTKIQNGDIHNLSSAEKEAVRILSKKNLPDNEIEEQNIASDFFLNMAERLEKRRKKDKCHDEYINSDFILSSVAEVERVWSHSKYVLTEHRRAMTPLMFEVIMFLKHNERFWDEQLVAEATRGARSERTAAQLAAHVQQEQFTSLES